MRRVSVGVHLRGARVISPPEKTPNGGSHNTYSVNTQGRGGSLHLLGNHVEQLQRVQITDYSRPLCTRVLVHLHVLSQCFQALMKNPVFQKRSRINLLYKKF